MAEVPPESAALAEIESALHRLDQELNRLRQRIFHIEKGLVRPPDPEAALAELRQRFAEAGQEFVRLYRQWQALQR